MITAMAKLFHYYRHHVPHHRGKGDIVNWLGLFLAAHPFPWRLGKVGIVLEMRLNDRVSYHIFDHGVWEPDETRLIECLLRPGDTFVDVGANMGYFTVIASKLVGEHGRVLACEPVPPTKEWLERNLELNHAINTTVFPVAVGSEEGVLDINVFGAGEGLRAKQSLGDSSAFTRPDRPVVRRFRVPVRSLDALVGELDVGPMLIKLDIEGGELAALRGASRVLASHRPLVLFELNPTMAQAAGWNPDELFGLLESTADYQFHIPHDEALIPLDRANDVMSLTQGGDIDVLAYCPSLTWHRDRVHAYAVRNSSVKGG